MEQFFSRTEKIKDGSIILEEGSWAYYAYVLQSGRAKVWKTINSKQVLVGTLKEGDIFGEMSFFGMAKRTASVTADGDVIVGMITKDTFMEAVNKLPKEAHVKLDKMTQDLLYLNDAYNRLTNCIREISDIKGRMIDPKLFEKEVENMPDLLREVVGRASKRFISAIDGSIKLMAQLEEASRTIDSLSTTLIRNVETGKGHGKQCC
ncbi:MAG TPA: Crp/Fnr family transcriptional regulator [Candidatus Wunengus sp. YC63]|uniref:Crp/Fnr family transcriptional regulator n=1 Tax=unclassified Candidatus Wunengus TaxID=3367695 RepID=UPI001E05E6D9|nr:cyclic nucleotide-binding domain-containing protein [Planctomycetota bacterium]